MTEQTLIRAEQIEGLADLVREQVKAALAETGPALQDVEEIRRSPAGILIRLEGKVDALETKMEERFRGVEQRFEALGTSVDQRFTALQTSVDQRFTALQTSVDQRFESLERRFTVLQWVVILIYPFLLAILGKLFLGH